MPRRHGVAHRITLADGRHVAFEESGSPNGWPVFLLHGTPGSRSGPKPRESILYRLGVRLIAYDRPGYGGSTRLPGRTVATAAADVAQIADYLNIARFSVVGRSGGGPHALACAALLDDRVERTAVLVSVATADAEDLDWTDGMTDDNVAAYAAVESDLAELIDRLQTRAVRTVSEPDSLVEMLLADMTEADKRIVTDVAIRRQLGDTYVEALRQGHEGWLDDILAFRRPWGFDLSVIRRPVRLWHGREDNFSPVRHTFWLARHIPGAEVHVQPDAAHFGAVEILPEILPWLAGNTTAW